MMSGAPSSSVIVGLLADRDRRLVLAGLLLGADEPGDIASQVGLGVREVLAALDRLVAGGLVEPLVTEDGSDRFHLLEGAFQRAARADGERTAASDQAESSAFADEPAERRTVLERAIQDGRLVQLPAKHAKRLIVLDHIAQRFEPGVHYTERQVNALLSSLDPDVATLRRWLVDVGMMDRADGVYWRSGASVDV